MTPADTQDLGMNRESGNPLVYSRKNIPEDFLLLFSRPLLGSLGLLG
jgi:hypothetical protein